MFLPFPPFSHFSGTIFSCPALENTPYYIIKKSDPSDLSDVSDMSDLSDFLKLQEFSLISPLLCKNHGKHI